MKLIQFMGILAVAIVASFMAARYFANPVAPKASHKETTAERVLRTGVIRCAYADYRPVFWKDPNTGKMDGIFYDITNELGRRLGLKIDWVEEVGYGTIAEGFKTDRYDMFCASVLPTTERARAASFSIPVYYVSYGAVVRAGDNRLQDDKRLNADDITFAVKDGDISDSFANMYFPLAKRTSISQLGDMSQLLEDVATGKADATIIGLEFFSEYDAHNPGKLIYLHRQHPLIASPYVMMLKPDEYQFKMMVDTALAEMINGGFVDRVLDKFDTYGTSLRLSLPYRLDKEDLQSAP